MAFIIFMLILLFFIIITVNNSTSVNSNPYESTYSPSDVDTSVIKDNRKAKFFSFKVEFENTKENQSWFHYIMKDANEDVPRKEQFREMSHEEIVTFVEIGEKVYQYSDRLVSGIAKVADSNEHGFPTLNLYARLSNYDLHYIGYLSESDFQQLKDYDYASPNYCFIELKGGKYKTPYVNKNGEIKVQTLAEPYEVGVSLSLYEKTTTSYL